MNTNNFRVAINIGTTKICTMVARIKENKSYQVMKITVLECEGMNKGLVVDEKKVSECINKSVENIWSRLEKSGDIYLDKYSGWYSVSDEAYYDEDEIETLNGKKVSKISGSKVDWVEEESYFFKLSAWSNRLLDHYKNNPNFIMPSSISLK